MSPPSAITCLVSLAPLFGLKVEKGLPEGAENFSNAIYIANHQNNYDMVTACNIVLPPTVTVGKKSLLWILFGPALLADG